MSSQKSSYGETPGKQTRLSTRRSLRKKLSNSRLDWVLVVKLGTALTPCALSDHMKTSAVSVLRRKVMARSGGLRSSLLWGSKSEDCSISLTNQSLRPPEKPLRIPKRNTKRNWSELGVAVGRHTVRRLIASLTQPGCVECCETALPDRKEPWKQ